MVYPLRPAQICFAVALLLILWLTGLEAEARRGELRPVRATIGCVEVRNWENNLVKVNPNLRHYHWNPIYANVQGTRLVGPPAPPKQRLTSRPQKMAASAKRQKDSLKFQKTSTSYIFRPVKERPSVYKRPAQMAPQRNTKAQVAYKHVAPTLTSKNTSLSYKHVAPSMSNRDAMGRLMPQEHEPMTATKAELQRKALMARLDPGRLQELNAQSKQLATKNVNGSLGHKDCYGAVMQSKCEGQLVAKACEATLADKAAVYAPYSRVEALGQRTTKTKVAAQIRHY